ncbi:hypothetical protein T484DRAFT_1757434 [Baffinella frigidus]|nr:hypothetical protein T484DRAFT_1757434 [Cryptophyta sp. CCMP2293]
MPATNYHIAQEGSWNTLATVDRQCMMCGWPYKWSSGDESALGSALYAIERLYIQLPEKAYTTNGLFTNHERAHVLHKHAKDSLKQYNANVLNLKPEGYKKWNAGSNEEYNGMDELDKFRTYLSALVRTPDGVVPLTELPKSPPHMVQWQDHNMEIIEDNVMRQVMWTFDTALATHGAFVEDERTTKDDVKTWLTENLKTLSSDENMKNRDMFDDGYVHATCYTCNRQQTMTQTFWTTVWSVVGIDKPALKPTKKTAKAAARNENDEDERDPDREEEPDDAGNDPVGHDPEEIKKAAFVDKLNHKQAHVAIRLMQRIRSAVGVKLLERYEMRKSNHRVVGEVGTSFVQAKFLKHFICLLIQLNLQVVTACLHDATAITRFSLAHKKDVKPLLRNKYQSYAAILGSSIMHVCMTTSHDIVHAGEGVHSNLGISCNLDEFWKYVVTESADAHIGKDYVRPSTRVGLFNRSIRADGRNNSRTSGNNVFEYFFKDAASIQRFQGERSAEAYNKGFSELLKDSLGSVSDVLDGGLGMAMFMFILENKSTQTTNHDYFFKLHTMPPIHARIAKLSRAPDSDNQHSGHLETTTNDVRDAAIQYFKQMTYILNPHKQRYESLAWILGSDLNPQSSPGEWGLKMRAQSHKSATRMLLRLPLMLNGMAPSHCKAKVQFIIKTLLLEPDPLHPVNH